MQQSEIRVHRLVSFLTVVAATMALTACHTLESYKGTPAPKEVTGLKLVLTEKGTIGFADANGKPVEGVLPTELKGYASNEILNITNYTVIQLKKNPCYVLVCGRVCAWQKVSDGPCP